MSLYDIVKTVLLCVFYMIVGPGLILLNKHILSGLNFPYPMFLSGLGVLCSGIVARILVKFNFVSFSKGEHVEGMLWYVVYC